MSIIILSDNQPLSQHLSQLLYHYFPSSTQELKLITISTKYYAANIPIQIHAHQQQPTDKADLVLFLFQAKEKIPFFQGYIDNTIAKLSPYSTMILVHDEEGEGNWVHQDDLLECENLVEVVYENVYKVHKERPQWKQMSLLEAENEATELFLLFDLMQTTEWTNMIKNQFPTHQNIKNDQMKEEIKEITKEENENNENEGEKEKREEKQEKMDKKEEKQKEEEEPTQQELQAEMAEFENLMHQMLSLKQNPPSEDLRKAKAEQLILKMTKNMDF